MNDHYEPLKQSEVKKEVLNHHPSIPGIVATRVKIQNAQVIVRKLFPQSMSLLLSMDTLQWACIVWVFWLPAWLLKCCLITVRGNATMFSGFVTCIYGHHSPM